MEWLELRCKLSRCDYDNSTGMSLTKCVLQRGGAPCIYLSILIHPHVEEDELWEKFKRIVKGGEEEKRKKTYE